MTQGLVWSFDLFISDRNKHTVGDDGGGDGVERVDNSNNSSNNKRQNGVALFQSVVLVQSLLVLVAVVRVVVLLVVVLIAAGVVVHPAYCCSWRQGDVRWGLGFCFTAFGRNKPKKGHRPPSFFFFLEGFPGAVDGISLEHPKKA